MLLRWLVALALLAVSARCQLVVFSSDIFGHYVPFDNTTGADCPLNPVKTDKLSLLTIQLESTEENLTAEDDGWLEQAVTPHWGDCGRGGVPRYVPLPNP